MDAFLPLIKKALRRISIRLPSYVEREDLLQSALVGLFESIERFDPKNTTNFDAFATKRIRGAIMDELRRDDYLSRNARVKVRKIKSAAEELVNELGRSPDDEEIAEKAGMALPEMNSLMEAAAPMASLDDAIVGSCGGYSVSLKDVISAEGASPADEAEKSDMLDHLCKAFRSLSDREQKILYLYYHEFLRVKEIAELFEVSEARICQIHSVTLVKLRAVLNAD
jgi:RNA polymerase sigma factor for flagellar operon FliA